MVEKIFSKLNMPKLEPFENYLPTAFSSELSLLQKVNNVINELIETNKLTNEMVDYLNEFYIEYVKNMKTLQEYVDGRLDVQDDEIKLFKEKIEKWLSDFETWVLSQGLEEYMLRILEEWEENGRFGELILKATELFGDISTFRVKDKYIIDKIKNEFGERGGTNVKEFGVVADGVTDDSEALQRALDSGKDLVFPNETINLYKSVWLRRSNVTLTFYNTTIKTNKALPYLFKIGAEQAPNFVDNIALVGKLTLDGMMMGINGLEVTNARVKKIDGLTVKSFTGRQIYVYRSSDSGTGWASICSANLTNIELSMGAPFNWQTDVGTDNIGLEIATDDCYIYNVNMVHQTTAIVNKGGNTYDRIHAWLINDYQMKKGIFFDLYAGSPISRAFSDTYYISYNINKSISFRLSDVRNFFNQTYYSLDKVYRKKLNKPIIFNFKTIESRASNIYGVNSLFAGLIDGGGDLFNVNQFIENVNFINCTFDNLTQDTLNTYQKEEMKETWETGELKSKNGSTFKPKTNQIASVTLKPYTIVAEEMNGEFSPSKQTWYKKNSNAVLEYYNDILKVSGNGSIKFGGAYLDVDYETHLFIRFRFKCAKECKLSIVDRDSGLSITDDLTIYQKDGWHDEYFIFKVNQPVESYDVEFLFDVKNPDTELNTIEITELTLFDIFKRNIGYMFETVNDLASRLADVGFVLNERVLPIPQNQDFVVKSIPKNYGCRIVEKESNSITEYTAFRSLQGLEIIGKEGTSPYKTFKRSVGLNKDARLRGSLFHYIKTNIVDVKSEKLFPSNTTFSDDISIDGKWEIIHFSHKDKIKAIRVNRTNTKVGFSKLLSSNENVSGNRCTIVEEFLTPISNAKTFSTPYMTATSGYHKLPIFKDGTICVQSGGGGFVEVEVLYSE